MATTSRTINHGNFSSGRARDAGTVKTSHPAACLGRRMNDGAEFLGDQVIGDTSCPALGLEPSLPAPIPLGVRCVADE